MKLRSVVTALALWAVAHSAFAVPAKPGIMTFTQPDGTVVEAGLKGDEHFHFYETAAGEILLRDADGYLRRAVVDAAGEPAASAVLPGRSVMSTSERENVIDAIGRRYDAIREAKAAAASRVAPDKIKVDFPTTGEVRGLIILADFQDVKLLPKSTKEYFDTKLNTPGYSGEETMGSAHDYFKEQSGGKFQPVFDVVGPVTLPKNRADYGVSEDLISLFRDACVEADKAGTDFTRYDVNNDGFVDFVFIIFAGHGQAQGGPVETIWPAMMDVSNSIYDYFDGLNLSVAACSCELKGAEGEDWDGMGTICHEFSHILGLPDIYDARQTGGYGMGHYDLMCYGPYNADGVKPAGYTAMDKYTLGWIEPKVLEAPETGVKLDPFSAGGDAYFIVNPENPNEYYTLENRQPVGFDAGLPGHGLVVSYVHYEQKHWKRNTVNAAAHAGYEHVRILPADGSLITSDVTGKEDIYAGSEAGDPFPGKKEVTSLSVATHPSAKWYSNGKNMEHTLTNIRDDENGVITFDFDSQSGIDDIVAAGEDIRGGHGCVIAPEGAEVYTLAGARVGTEGLAPGIYIVRTEASVAKVVVK